MNDPLINLTPNPSIPQIFELADNSNEEWENLLNWANALDGGGSVLPPQLSAGDILVRRPSGVYQIYRHFDRSKPEAGTLPPVSDQELRLQLLAMTGGDVTKARAAEKWVTGELGSS